ncbi:MAG: ZIP family metal transporter [Candidatus Zipacnadales bacterium]
MFPLWVYSLVVLAVTWIAGLLPLAANWRHSHRDVLAAFASGVLLGAAFLHMLPETAQHCPQWSAPATLMGLLFLFLLERVIITHYCEHDHDACSHFEVIGYTFYLGLTLHSFLDGVVLGSGALIPALGPIVFLAIVAHKFPVIFSLSSILLVSGFRQQRVLGLLGILSLTVPVGAFAAFYGLRSFEPHIWQIAIAVSAGTFLYVSLVDLLPSIARESRQWFRCVIALLGGLLLMYLSGFVTPS